MKIVKYKILLLLLVLTLIFFHKLIFNFGQIIYPAPDIFYVTYIEKVLFLHSIVNYNSLPFWNPYIFGGSPFLGNPTSTMFYPLNLLFLLLPIGSVFGYIFTIDSFLLGAFTYFYARTIKIDEFGSLISAVTIMFSGPMITSVFAGHPILSDTFIWFPLALLFFELMLLKRKLIFVVLSGLTIALMFFAGAPQTTIYQILSLFMYFLLRSVFEAKTIREFLKLSILPIIAISIAILTAAVQLFPSFEFSKLSQRGYNGISYVFASDFSLHPYQILSFIFPHFFGSPVNQTYWGKGNFWELNGYIGVLPLIFAALALFAKKNKYTFIFLIIGLFAVLHALGKYSYIFPFFFYHVPGFNNFRVPSRSLFIYVFSFSMLSGIGASYLINSLINKIRLINRKTFTLIPAIIFLLISSLLIIGTNKTILSAYEKYVLRNSFAVGINHSLLYSQTRSDIIFFLVSLLFLYITIALKKKNIIKTYQLKGLVVFFVFLDLWLFGSRFIDTRSLREILKPTAIIDRILEDKSTYRVFDMTNDYIPLLSKNRIESITGSHSLYLKTYRDFLWSVGKHANTPYESSFQIYSVNNPILLSLLNTKYLISDKELHVQGFSEILRSNAPIEYFPRFNPSYYLYKNTELLPRAYLVPNAILTTDRQQVLNLLTDKNFNPKKYVVLENQSNNIKIHNTSEFKEVNLSRENYNKFSLNTTLKDSGFLALSEINYPGWVAYDNGKKIEILKANYILRAMFLQKGQHSIILAYTPNFYQIGLAISLLTLSFSFLYIIIYVYRR